MPSAEYSAVPTETVVVVSNEQQCSPDLTDRIKASSRVVAVFCVIQLVLAAIGLLSGNFIGFCITALFVALGLAGVAKRNHRLLIAHFVYSVVVYVLSLVGIVLLVLYVDCDWLTYVMLGLFVIIQAVGLKHCRLLIWAVRKANGVDCCGSRPCARDTAAPEPVPAPAPAPAPVPVPVAVPYPMPINGQTFVQTSRDGSQTQSTSFSTNVAPAPTAPAMPMMYPPLPQMAHPAGFQPFVMQPYNPYGPNGFPMMPMASQPQYVPATQSPRIPRA